MKIYPISNASVYNGKQQASKPQNFKGIWMRLGQNYLDNTSYCAGIFYSFTDGKHLAVFKDRLGRKLLEFGSSGINTKEGKLIWDFLFENKESTKGYKALKKLRAFMLNKTYNQEHNVMFLEKEDSALVTEERKQIRLAIVNQKIKEFEEKNGMLPKPQPEPFIKRKQRVKTAEELLKFLSDNGVA